MVATTIYFTSGGANMGFFGGGGNSGGQSSADALVETQIKNNQAEIEQKKRSLYQERLDIIHGQAGQQWHPKGKQ